jgi:hypothetical protein
MPASVSAAGALTTDALHDLPERILCTYTYPPGSHPQEALTIIFPIHALLSGHPQIGVGPENSLPSVFFHVIVSKRKNESADPFQSHIPPAAAY